MVNENLPNIRLKLEKQKWNIFGVLFLELFLK